MSSLNANMLYNRAIVTDTPDLLNVSIDIKKQPQRKSLVHMHQGCHFGVILRVANFT